ncbi:MAG: FHA domain-containing protein [Chloroflexota bacterium]|nr:FHA domain-containing protein [Chloroflexota bacterium]
MSGILARIKALFEPKPIRSAAPPQEVEAAPIPAATPPELAETRLPEPITAIAESPVAEAIAPSFVAGAALVVEEAAPIIEQAAPVAYEAPIEVEETVPPTPAGGLTLRLESERGSKSTFQVTRSGATIGRGPESTIQLADLSVSRKHAKITYRQGAYWLSDLGSMGGTWIDGTKLAAPRRVATGQTIDIGLCRLSVVTAPDEDGSEEESAVARSSKSVGRGR